jgi:hypothetical protein
MNGRTGSAGGKKFIAHSPCIRRIQGHFMPLEIININNYKTTNPINNYGT